MCDPATFVMASSPWWLNKLSPNKGQGTINNYYANNNSNTGGETRSGSSTSNTA